MAQSLRCTIWSSLPPFVLGVIGVLTRRNVVIVLMSIELILNAVNLNLVAFSRIGDCTAKFSQFL